MERKDRILDGIGENGLTDQLRSLDRDDSRPGRYVHRSGGINRQRMNEIARQRFRSPHEAPATFFPDPEPRAVASHP